jgi:hypothetical protein
LIVVSIPPDRLLLSVEHSISGRPLATVLASRSPKRPDLPIQSQVAIRPSARFGEFGIGPTGDVLLVSLADQGLATIP